MAKTLLIVLFIAVVAYASDWPCFRGNLERTGYSTEKVGIPGDKPVWVYSLGNTTVSSPSVADNLLIIGARDSSVYALETGDGTLRWKRKTQGWVDCSPTVSQKKAIIGSRDGRIYVFDLATGDSLSTLNAGLQLSSPAVLDDSMVLASLGPPFNGFGVYDLSNPATKWFLPFRQISYSSPAISSGMSVVADNSGLLYGVSLSGKRIAWTLQTNGGAYLSSPAIDNGTAFFAPGNYDMNIYRVVAGTGQLHWKSYGIPVAKRRADTIGSSGLIAPKQFIELLRLSPVHRQAAIDRLAKRGISVPKVFTRQLGKSTDSKADSISVWDFYPYGDMKTSSVAVGPNLVYVIQKELGYPKPRFTIFALDKETGNENWYYAELRNSEKLGYCSSPVVADNKVFFGWGEGMAYCLDAKTGAKLWSDTLDGDIISSPAIANGRLYMATMNGSLYAFDLTGTPQPLNFQDGTYGYPNPASRVSKIQYFIQKPGDIEVLIYDTAERMVKVFRRSGVQGNTKAAFTWDISNAANGVYFAKVIVRYRDGGSESKILKIAVIK